MKKSLLLASLVAAVALAACGKKEEAAPAPAPAPAATTPAPMASEPAAAASAANSAADAAASAAAGAATPWTITSVPSPPKTDGDAADRVLVLADGKLVHEMYEPTTSSVVDYMKTFSD